MVLTLPGRPPSVKVDVSWDDFLHVHLLWPLVVQVALTLVFALALRPAYLWTFNHTGWFHSFVKHYLGSRDRPEVPNAGFLVTICLLQMASSLMSILLWSRNLYTQSTDLAVRLVLLGNILVDLVHWSMSHLRGGFSPLDLWSFHGLIDGVSIVPGVMAVFFELPYGMDWLTLRFLRANTMLKAYQEVLSSGHFNHQGVLAQMIVLAALRIYCLVVPMAGVMITLEILGDPQLLFDSYIETPYGDEVSPLMMINWVIVSIITLGDGAFYPKTTASRCLWSVFLCVAVAYVFYIQFAFGNAWVLHREGTGTYRPRKRRKHVVVFLQVKGYAVQLSSVVLGFLSEALNTKDADKWPDIVFFCESYWDDNNKTQDADSKTLQQFLKAKHFGSSMRERVHFVVGKATRKEDLERAALAESQLTYILPDISTDSPARDDELNIFTALQFKRFYPNVRLRLMLLLPQSKEIAVQSGIMMERCFSVRELKAHMLAQNVRCHGMVPLITGIFKNVDVETEAMLRGDAISSMSPCRGSTRKDSPSTPCKPPSPVKNTPTGALPTSASRHDIGESSPNSHGLHGNGHSPPTVDPWVLEYIDGVSRGIVGFELAFEYAHLTFGQIVAKVFGGCGAVVIGALMDGGIQVCPQDRSGFHRGQVFFAIAKDESDLDAYRDHDNPPGHWRETLLHTRDNLMRRSSVEGPHIAAAKLIGKQLQDVILKSGEEEMFMSENEPIERQTSDESQRSAGTNGAELAVAARRRSVVHHTANSMQSFMTGQTGGGSFLTGREQREEEAQSAVQSVRLLRRQCAGSQELVVVVVCQGEVWQQVRAFVSSLRSRYQPVFRPIVVLAPTEPPPRLFQGALKERVLTLVGSCLKVEQLIEAGVLEADSVVIMSGEPNRRDRDKADLKDSTVVLCARMMECWCGISSQEIFTTYELQDSSSVGDLPPLMSKPAVELENFLLEKAFDDSIEEETEGEETDEDHPKISGALASPMKMMRSSDNMIRRADANASVESITFNMRFAAGQVMTPEVWGCMLGRMYYNPAVIELSEALVMPQRRGQRSFPWQVRPPKKYIGQTFEDLVVDFALGTWTHPEVCHKDIDNCLPTREGPAVAMALYRKREGTKFQPNMSIAEGTGGSHYLVLAPPATVTIVETDWVIALGSRRFGHKAMQMGLLRGVRKQGKVQGRVSSKSNSEVLPFERRVSPGRNKEKMYAGRDRVHVDGRSQDDIDFKECMSHDSVQAPLLESEGDFREMDSGAAQAFKPAHSARWLHRGRGKEKVAVFADQVEEDIAEHDQQVRYVQAKGEQLKDTAQVPEASGDEEEEPLSDHREVPEVEVPQLPRNGGMPFVPMGNRTQGLMLSPEPRDGGKEALEPTPVARRLANRQSTGFVRAPPSALRDTGLHSFGSGGHGHVRVPAMASVKEGEEEEQEEEVPSLHQRPAESPVRNLPSTQHVFVGVGGASPSPRGRSGFPGQAPRTLPKAARSVRVCDRDD